MTYSTSKSDYKIKLLEFKAFNTLGERVDYFKFSVRNIETGKSTEFTINNWCRIAEPDIDMGDETESLGAFIRDISYELLQNNLFVSI